MHLVLVAPEIAPNTGNIIRLCANVGATLHLVEPLGFSLEDKLLRRAGLDYHDLADVQHHGDWKACLLALGDRRRFALSSHAAGPRYTDIAFQADDVIVFGCESVGLSAEVLGDFPVTNQLRIPMQPNNRSLNLSNACAVVLFEAWRQLGFAGAQPGEQSPGQPKS
jgi:tRNA (cytidine/uridine-2'-O-)-methyltransferase